MAEPFIAEVRIWALNFAPRGWAFCNGQLLPIAQNTALFAIIGTTYGGDGQTTLGLPNLQGRAPMHAGQGPGLTPRQLGASGGVETVTLSNSQVPGHTHAMQASPSPGEAPGPGGNAFARVVGGSPYAAPGTTVSLAAEALPDSVGGGQAHNNLQPYLALTFVIAVIGVFPSRN
jgi:microcystin-dependent protein